VASLQASVPKLAGITQTQVREATDPVMEATREILDKFLTAFVSGRKPYSDDKEAKQFFRDYQEARCVETASDSSLQARVRGALTVPSSAWHQVP
jgi:hypothetical protein